MVISLITASLLAAAAVLTPTIAEAAPPTTSVALAHSAPPASPKSTEPRSPADPHLAEAGTATPPASTQWRSPVGGLDLLTRFDPPPQPWLPGHRGVDLAASQGLPVTAAGAGTVVFAGDLAGRGVISIVHANGLRTTYEPVEPLVAAGDTVTVGQTIGQLQPGHASCTDTACLHLGLKRGPLYLDPMLLFGSGKVRLLPRPGRTERPAEHEPERDAKAPTVQSAEARKPNATSETQPEHTEAGR
jgi:murein DD-endopeptidase MepM/ murein hydrolase activator NlpD